MLSWARAKPGMTLVALLLGLDRGDLEVGRLEGVAAVVEMERLERVDHPASFGIGLSARCG